MLPRILRCRCKTGDLHLELVVMRPQCMRWCAMVVFLLEQGTFSHFLLFTLITNSFCDCTFFFSVSDRKKQYIYKRVKYFFKNNYLNKIGIFVKFMSKVFMKMEELKRVQEFRIDELSTRRRKLTEKTGHCSMNSQPEFRNYRMNDSKDLKDVESVRSGPSHVQKHQQGLHPPYHISRGIAGFSRWNAEPW